MLRVLHYYRWNSIANLKKGKVIIMKKLLLIAFVSLVLCSCGAKETTYQESPESSIQESTEQLSESKADDDENNSTISENTETETEELGSNDIESTEAESAESESTDVDSADALDKASQYYDYYANWLTEFMECTDCSKTIGSEYELIDYATCKERACFSLADVNQDGIDELLVAASYDKGNMLRPNIIIPADTWEDANLGVFDAIYIESAECVVNNGEYGGTVSFYKLKGSVLELNDYIEYDFDFEIGDYVNVVYHHADGSLEEMDVASFDAEAQRWQPNVKAQYDLTPENVQKVLIDR